MSVWEELQLSASLLHESIDCISVSCTVNAWKTQMTLKGRVSLFMSSGNYVFLRLSGTRSRPHVWFHEVIRKPFQYGELHHQLQELRLNGGRCQWYFRLSGFWLTIKRKKNPLLNRSQERRFYIRLKKFGHPWSFERFSFIYHWLFGSTIQLNISYSWITQWYLWYGKGFGSGHVQ